MNDLIKLDFETDEGYGSRARIGLIVLESDQTIEVEAGFLDIDGVDFYHARVPNEMEVTPETLTDMKKRLPAAAALLPAEFGFDAIGYGCTSASTLIGDDGVADAIRSAHPDMACSNPIAAAVRAFSSLGAKRIAVITPYTADVTQPIVDRFEANGFDVSAVGSFQEASDLVVARISEASITAAVRQISAQSDCDAVFVSCTSLRSLRFIDAMEQAVGKPVVSSNLALYWHLIRMAGVTDHLDGFGTLFRTDL